MEENNQKFEKQKEILLKNKKQAEQRLQNAQEKYDKIKKSDVDRKEMRLEIAMKVVAMRKRALQILEEQVEFFRPSNEEDIAYRLRQYEEFSKIIKNIVPNDIPLRFHGCPINAAKHILEDGEISSSVDRIGIESSYDVSDQVSVTTKDTVETTVQGYAGLIGLNYNMPAGCIFVVLPKDELDAKAGESMLMGNISFKESPERLVAIITTPENLQRVSRVGTEIRC